MVPATPAITTSTQITKATANPSMLKDSFANLVERGLVGGVKQPAGGNAVGFRPMAQADIKHA